MAGMAGAVLFVSVFTIYGWLNPNYSWTRMFVSELSLGPYGWVQVLNFVLTGALILMFGRGLAAHFRAGAASRAGPVLVQCIGVSLIASGPFVTDPSAMFGQSSTHGIVHGIFGAVVFTFAPLSCFVFYRRFRSDPRWRPLSVWTLISGVVLALGIGLLRISQQPGSDLLEWKGLVQRAILVTFMAWIFAVAFRLRHLCRV
ncbi:putative membrane protein [Pseudarthrobacter oxydans]|nr:putative membrane protein [Pseudarthrobacter oxydans]